MFEEAAIARKESMSTSPKPENTHEGERHGSVSAHRQSVTHEGERHGSVSVHRQSSGSMDPNPQRQMSTTEIDLESVLQVRRRRLSVTTPQASQDSHRYTDVIILKVEKSNDILKEEARCVFHGDYHVLSDIFQKYTSNIKIHHEDPDKIKNHDRLSGKIYTTLELPTMTFIEVLEILHKHYFSIVANSTNFGTTTKLQEFILLRNKDTHDSARSLPTIDTKTY